LRHGLTVTRACIEAEVAFSTVHSWRTHDPEFKAKWDEAIEQGTDLLQDVATQRALAGSDTLLMFLLRMRRPEKYRRSAEDQHRATHDRSSAGSAPADEQARARRDAA